MEVKIERFKQIAPYYPDFYVEHFKDVYCRDNYACTCLLRIKLKDKWIAQHHLCISQISREDSIKLLITQVYKHILFGKPSEIDDADKLQINEFKRLIGK